MAKRRRRRQDDDDGNDIESNDESSSSSSSYSSDSSSERRHHKRKKKKSKKKKRRKDSSRKRYDRKRVQSDDDDNNNDDEYDKRKEKKRDHRHRNRSHHREEDDSDSFSNDDSTSQSDDDSRSHHKRKRRKKEKRKSKHKHKKHNSRHHDKKGSKKKKRKDREDNNDDKINLDSKPNSQGEQNPQMKRNYQVAKALVNVFQDNPVFVKELPLILIRIAGGTTFDLSQMTDRNASYGLQKVFESLTSFGVQKNKENGLWMFQVPTTGGSKKRDELILLRIIRALLDEIGLTMDAIQEFETKEKELSSLQNNEEEDSTTILDKNERTITTTNDEELEHVKDETRRILEKFQTKDSKLGVELRALCKEIVDGQSISLDGLDDDVLRESLQSLFVQVGLEKSEIEEDSDDEEEDEDDEENETDKNDENNDKEDEGPLMGYGLPETNDERVQIKLAAVMQICREPKLQLATSNNKAGRSRVAAGPLRKEDVEASSSTMPADDDDESEDEGPLPVGATNRRQIRGPAMPPEMVQAQVKARQQEFKAATEGGGSIPTEEGKREEWMLVPGKYDFLGAIKSGQTKSRNFKNKKSKSDDPSSAAMPVHPAIQAELDEIMEAHANARGPSLIDQHRAKKQQEKEAALASGKEKEWKWSRDDDLDKGRRVDKDALHMVLGGAADNLKTKFQGGFNK